MDDAGARLEHVMIYLRLKDPVAFISLRCSASIKFAKNHLALSVPKSEVSETGTRYYSTSHRPCISYSINSKLCCV